RQELRLALGLFGRRELVLGQARRLLGALRSDPPRVPPVEDDADDPDKHQSAGEILEQPELLRAIERLRLRHVPERPPHRAVRAPGIISSSAHRPPARPRSSRSPAACTY